MWCREWPCLHGDGRAEHDPEADEEHVRHRVLEACVGGEWAQATRERPVPHTPTVLCHRPSSRSLGCGPWDAVEGGTCAGPTALDLRGEAHGYEGGDGQPDGHGL